MSATSTSRYAPGLPHITSHAALALLARVLFREGYDDHIAGHITFAQDDGTLLVTPARLPWDEVRAGDIMRVDPDGNVLEGEWTVTPALGLHLELHASRPDVIVGVHNHPVFGTAWADLGRIPPIYDQTSTLGIDLVLFDDYDGTFLDRENARNAVKALGAASMALLSNHGVLVVAPSIELAYLRCIGIERRCRMAWYTEAIAPGIPLRADVADQLGRRFADKPMTGLFEAMVRRELYRDPRVLDPSPTPDLDADLG